ALPVHSWFLRYFALGGHTRVLQNLSYCFDFGVFELLTTLHAGGTLCFLPVAEQGDLSRYLETVEERDLNTVHTTPSFFRELTALAARRGRGLAGLELVHLGGEAINRDLLQAIAGVVDEDCRVYNGYGPTETSINSTVFRMQGRPLDRGVRGAVVPIGRPTAANTVVVLDRRGLPVPLGVAGELAIGGAGVARAYLNRAARTAERFVPDPFAGHPDRRLYRSGDLVRWLAEGEIEFLGRIDHQVKIRGLRIELGEISSALARHPAVRDAVVVVREDAGDRRLAAYLVAEGESAPAVTELRQTLKETLPEYMVPAAFVVIDALPLTPNGKVDRAALSRRDLPVPGQVGADLAPRDAVELELVRIWEELLGMRPLGIRSNFFELGGHSLLAVRLMARIRQQFGRDLPLTTLFQEDTVEHLAAVLRQEPNVMRRRALVAIQPQGSQPPWFFVHPAGGNVLCYRDLSHHLGPDQPLYGLQVPDREGELFLTTIEEMAEHYVAAVRELRTQGPYRLGGWSLGGLVALEMARQLSAQNQRVEALVLLDSVAPTARQHRPSETGDAALALAFARDLAGIFGVALPGSSADIETFPTAEEVLETLHETMQAAGLVPPDLELSEIIRLFATFRINVRAMERYKAPVFSGRLVLFKARERLSRESETSDLGWGELAKGGLEIHEVEGNHYSILRDPHVEELADCLKEVLDRPGPDGPPSELRTLSPAPSQG
ncbi:MAG: AMP-binding protein, partial [bacterium]|nr:AMP-binding protein [bacterium]